MERPGELQASAFEHYLVLVRCGSAFKAKSPNASLEVLIVKGINASALGRVLSSHAKHLMERSERQNTFALGTPAFPLDWRDVQQSELVLLVMALRETTSKKALGECPACSSAFSRVMGWARRSKNWPSVSMCNQR
jgi:hypothetical protein